VPPPLLILVGLTGVGKSTAVEALLASVPGATLLPNRRALADRIVIPEAQRLDGREPHPVGDRLERFRLTARYRARYPGGLAHALCRHVRAAAPAGSDRLLFDNLRGESEVRFALDAFPGARFVVLEAPADVRVLRLAGRRDDFDRVAGRDVNGPGVQGPGVQGPGVQGPGAHGQGAPGADEARDETLRDRLLQVPGLARLTDVSALAAAAGGLEPDAVVTGARVVAEESSHYDPAATWALLEPQPPARRLRLDTGREPPDVVAARIRAWL